MDLDKKVLDSRRLTIGNYLSQDFRSINNVAYPSIPRIVHTSVFNQPFLVAYLNRNAYLNLL